MSIERVEQALAAATPYDPGRKLARRRIAAGLKGAREHVPEPDDEFLAGFLSGYLGSYIAVLENRDTWLHNLAPRFIDVVRAARPAHDSPYHRSMAPDCPLCRALAALDTAIQEELPKEGPDDQ